MKHAVTAGLGEGVREIILHTAFRARYNVSPMTAKIRRAPSKSCGNIGVFAPRISATHNNYPPRHAAAGTASPVGDEQRRRTNQQNASSQPFVCRLPTLFANILVECRPLICTVGTPHLPSATRENNHYQRSSPPLKYISRPTNARLLRKPSVSL